MAQIAPDSVDVTDLQFKIHSKAKLFNVHDGADLNAHNLLAAASSHGLVFSGSTSSDVRVVQLSTLAAEGSNKGTPVPTRVVPLPSKVFQIAVNCDHSLLAVDVTRNGICFIQVYSVPSFYANDVTLTHEFQIVGSCHSSHLLWNPVMNNVLAVVTENGGLVMYTLRSPGVEMCSLDGQQTVQSACWSPKGKQIVAGFPNGNLVQFKPDLKPARSIPCPTNVLGGNAFDTIAIQWLATYQFAAVFQSKAEDTTPALFIVNAPKTEGPKYINYDDICYSQSGPRKHQVFLTHILPWNLLIVASANSMEVGILGTTEQGDFPTWKQLVPADNARAELPLSASKQETFPMGMALELGVTHQITVGETTFPVMPMIHLLSTDGLLISFDLLNTMPNTPGICCPPNPIRNNTGLVYFKVPETNVTSPAAAPPPKPAPTPATVKSDLSFALGYGNATSTPTPAPVPAKSLFGTAMTGEPPKTATNLFGAPTASKPPAFGATTTTTGFGFGGLGSGQGAAVTQQTQKATPPPAFGSLSQPSGPQSTAAKSTFGFGTPQATAAPSNVSLFGQPAASSGANENNKPLITVPPTYTAATKPVSRGPTPTTASVNTSVGGDQTEEAKIVQGMIREEIDNFQKELRDLISRSKAIHTNIGTKEESVSMAKQLNELSKLNKEATEVNDSLTSDVHSLRLNLNETFEMVTEAKNKHKLYTSQNHLQMQDQYSMSQTSKRHLSRLDSMLKMTETQLFMITRQVDAQWADYQDMQKQKTKHTMKIPSLESVYQTISKQRDILAKHRSTLNALKSKMGMRDTVKALEITKQQDPVDSLTDSILSMSIIDQVQRENEKLNPRKLELLKECLKRHRTQIVKPCRPDRVGLNSEVVREKREHIKKVISDKEKAERKAVQVSKQQQQKPPAMTQSTPKTPEAQTSFKPDPKFEMPKPKPQIRSSFDIVATGGAAPTNLTKPIATTQPSSGFGFGMGSSPQSEPSKFSFAQLNPQTTSTPFGNLSKAPVPSTTTPFSTSAQKLGGAKPELPKPTFVSESPKSPAVPASSSSGFSFSGLNMNKPTETKTGSSPLMFGTTTITPVVKPVAVAVEEKPKEEPKSTISFGGSGGGLFGSLSSTPSSTASIFGGFGPKQPEKVPEAKPEVKTVELPKSPLASLVETVNRAEFAGSTPTKPATVEKSAVFSLAKDVTPTYKEKTPEPTQIIKPTATFSFGFNAGQGDVSGSSPGTPTSVITPTSAGSTSTDSKSPSEFSFSTAAMNLSKPAEPKVEPKTSVAPTTGFSLSFGAPSTTPAPSTPPTTQPGSMFDSLSTPKPAPVTSGLFGNSGAGLFGTAAAQAVTSTTTATISATAVTTASAPSATAPTDGLFSGFNICSPSTPPSSATSPNASNIFGASTAFGASPQSPSSIFGGGGAATPESKPNSLFGTTTQPTQSPFGASMPKPDQSIFGGATAAANTSVFGGSTPTAPSSPFGQAQSTSSIFGGTATAPTSVASSPFGGGVAAASTSVASSPFGGGVTAAPATAATSPFGGSMFGGSASQTQSSPFGQPQQTSAFSQGGSLFGGSSSFGSGAAAGTTGTSGFGFGQAQTQQPVFGGGATFGSPPAFGSAFSKPSFGGAPTFGQKPLFGSPTQPTAQTAAPANSLFEQLGSQNSGMTFGNLAQSTPPQQQQQQQQQQQPSTFGGSAFSSWR